jgi:NAD(P)-dependent dehydrogenase (short-subunit alcohol dehydrogenase family)
MGQLEGKVAAAGRGTAGLGVYAASKAAVRSLTRTWAAELADRGIRVNALAPGSTDTPAVEAATPAGLTPAAFKETLAASVPLGRVSRPEEQAAAALFLASEQSGYVTGVELLVYGGVNSSAAVTAARAARKTRPASVSVTLRLVRSSSRRPMRRSRRLMARDSGG